MYPIEFLTDDDKDLIEKYILDYGFMYNEPYDNHINASIDYILRLWNENKTTLYKLFDNNLILRRPYTFTIPTDGLAYNIKNSKDQSYSRFYNIWWKEVLGNPGLNDILFYDKLTKTYMLPLTRFSFERKLTNLLDDLMLAKNSWDGEDYKFMFPDGEKYKISTGMKIIKIIHKFVQKFAPDCEPQFEAFRIWHSQILNNKYLDGEICLSIHPMDFMTMSDNDNNWRSCMRWTGDGIGDVGDYRAGTVECMNSPFILVAYLHSPDNPMNIGIHYDCNGNKVQSYKWNNKKWRELFIINKELITEIKAYPYQDENLTNTILMWIKELAKNNLGYEYNNNEVNISKDIIQYPEENCEFGISFDPSEYMYNDFGTLDKHRARVNCKELYHAIKVEKYEYGEMVKDNKNSYYLTIPYGGTANCMCCGELTIDSEERVICSNCDTGYICPVCGEPIKSSDDRFWMDDIDDYICIDCMENETATDDITGEIHLTSEMINIYYVEEYDEEGKPIFNTNNIITIYHGTQYWVEYERIFKTRPHYDQGYYKGISWGSAKEYYLTADDINDIDKFTEYFSNFKI